MMPTEQWRPIDGFPAYQVSNCGRVRSIDRTVSYRREGERRTFFVRGKVLKITVGSHGYGQVSLSDSAKATPACVHVLVAAAFIGARPPGLNVLHEDGDRSNCRACNLYYGSQADNLEDARRHGTIANGEKNGRAKLTIEQVRVIRRSRASQHELADRFGVRQGTIGFIKRNETWVGLT